MISSFIGFYQILLIFHLKPRRNNTSIHKLTINIGLILLLSSSFPIITKILGKINNFNNNFFFRNYFF